MMHRNIFYKDQAKHFPEVVRWDRCMVMKPNIFFFFFFFKVCLCQSFGPGLAHRLSVFHSFLSHLLTTAAVGLSSHCGNTNQKTKDYVRSGTSHASYQGTPLFSSLILTGSSDKSPLISFYFFYLKSLCLSYQLFYLTSHDLK